MSDQTIVEEEEDNQPPIISIRTALRRPIYS